MFIPFLAAATVATAFAQLGAMSVQISVLTLALKAGLPASVADDLKANIRPRNMQPDEEAVYDVCMTMVNKHEISDELFNRAKAVLGEQQLVDLIAVSGTYVTVAMLLSLGEESSPADKPLPFPEKGR